MSDNYIVKVVYASSSFRFKDEMGMGKTIQMISLLVSDQERPNLVIA